MSTRSNIGIKLGDGKAKVIYCHSDGYLDYNGLLLFKHYNTKERVEELLNLGNASFLTPKLHPDPSMPHSFDYDNRQDDVSVFYGRDRGEEEQEAQVKLIEDILNNVFIEYLYLFNLETNKWEVATYEQHEFKDLEEELIKEKVNFDRQF